MTTTTRAKRSTSRSAAPVEPRLAARRRQVKRSEGRRRLRMLIGLASVTALAIAALAVLQSGWLDVDEVIVEGATRTEPADVIDASAIEIGAPLVELDANGAMSAIGRLPWVDEVDVHRDWNGTITITVSERTPTLALASDRDNSRFVLIDASGRQLDVVDARPPGMVPVAGVLASGRLGEQGPPEAAGLIELLSLLSPEHLHDLSQIVVDDGSIYLDLVQPGRVRLGKDSELEQKLVSLDTILSTVDLRCLWEIDVRVPSAPAVTRMRADGVPRAPLTDLSTCT